MRIVEPLSDQEDVVTESSVTIEIVRGERTIRMQESFFGDDLVSEVETRAALRRLSESIVQAL
jgi:hypothetical protein